MYRMGSCVAIVLSLAVACTSTSPTEPPEAPPVPEVPAPAPTPKPEATCTTEAIKAWMIAEGIAKPEDELDALKGVEEFAAVALVTRVSDPGTFVLKDVGGTWKSLGNGSELIGWCKDHQADIPLPKCRRLLKDQ